MTALLGMIAPLKRYAELAVGIGLLAGVLWVYLALVHRAEAIATLTASNEQLATVNADGVNAIAKKTAELAKTTAALAVETKNATDNAALAGQLKERISHAPKDGCVGDAQRGLLDGLRTDALNRRSQVPQPVTP